MIRRQALPAGHVLPTERDLSNEFGVSRGLVRAAIKDLASKGMIEVKPRCRPVVLAGANSAVQPKLGKRHIGIWLWPNTADYAAASILKGIQRADIGSDVRLVVANAVGGDWESIFDSEAHFLHSMAQDPEEAGAIIWYLGGQRNVSALWELRKAGVATVFVDRLPPEEFPTDFVGTDNEEAARLAVQHLIGLGHRNIGFLSNIEPVSSVKEREAGYRRALKEAGIPLREDYIMHDLVDVREGVESALEAFLNLKEKPTAIFAVNDHIALQVCEVLHDRKIQVPEQMSVIGFDGILRWVPGGGYLTTQLQDFERIGQLAAELVMQRMISGPPSAYRHVLLNAPLLDRGSAAPPPARSPSFV
jgi:DNA-binding LacI/PurR family transcriptional regulator